jgi:hypothetical protein
MLLVVLFGLVLVGLLVRGDLSMSRRALAAGKAPPRVLAVAGTGDRSDLLYLVDTSRQRICVYRWSNPGLRLVAARAYDFDLEILDSSADRTIEGRGATRGYVKAQVEAVRRKQLVRPPEADG